MSPEHTVLTPGDAETIKEVYDPTNCGSTSPLDNSTSKDESRHNPETEGDTKRVTEARNESTDKNFHLNDHRPIPGCSHLTSGDHEKVTEVPDPVSIRDDLNEEPKTSKVHRSHTNENHEKVTEAHNDTVMIDDTYTCTIFSSVERHTKSENHEKVHAPSKESSR